jgi:1,4-dihydroxy-2-naphthoate octaprenyltransferase
MASLVGRFVSAGRHSRLKEIPKHRAWILACRPRTLTAAAAPVLVGTGLAFGHGGFRFLPALAALAGALLIQIGTNLANDYYDFVRGGDTEDRVGPLRLSQAGIFQPEVVRNAAFGVLGLALVLGFYLVAVGGIPILFIGVASLVCAVAYTGGPFPLAYHGLGDLFVFVFFGLVAVGGTYWVQALAYGPEVFLAGTGMGALATAILVVNNLRDIETDARAGKRTLAVRIGAKWTKVEFFGLVGVALVIPLLGIVWFGWGGWVLVTLASLVLLAEPARVIAGFSVGEDGAVLIPPLGGTAQATGLFGLLFSVALALG